MKEMLVFQKLVILMAKVVTIFWFMFFWFGMAIPYAINSRDDLMVFVAANGVWIGALVVVGLVFVLFKKQIDLLVEKIKEELQ